MNIIESTIAEFMNCYEQGDHHGIARCTRTMSRIIKDKPELFLETDPRKTYPLVMMVTECNMGEDAIAIAYYLVLKEYCISVEFDDHEFLKTTLLMCITCIIEHYHALNAILIRMHPRIPFYHLDCQIQSFYRKYVDYISYTEQEMLRSRVTNCCACGWIDPIRSNEICNSSVKEYIADFERYLIEIKIEKESFLY